MPTQSQLSPQTVVLDGGLDLITPSFSAAPGTLTGCLNFERTDRLGYSRTLGYEKIDGGCAPSLAYTNLVYIQHDSQATAIDPRTPLWLSNVDIEANGSHVLGYMVDSGTTQSLIAVVDFDGWQTILSSLGDIILTTPDTVNLAVNSVTDFDTTYSASGDNITAKELTEARNEYFRTLNNLVTAPFPIDKPIIGLQGYKDQIYAIKDLDVLHFINGNFAVFSNDILRPHSAIDDTTDLTILEIRVLTGTFAGGDAAGQILCYSIGTTIQGAYDVIRPASGAHASILTINNSLTALSTWGAGLWRTNSYQQALANDVEPGWTPVDMGYIFNFDDGTKYGPPHLARRGKFSNYTTDVSSTENLCSTAVTTDAGAGVWTYSGATLVDSISNQTGNASSATCTLTTFSTTQGGGSIALSDFDGLSDISTTDGIHVKGLEVKCRMVVSAPVDFSGVPSMQTTLTSSGTQLTGTDQKSTQLAYDAYNPSANPSDLILGGPEDLWGLSADDLKAALDANFGVLIAPSIAPIDPSRSNDDFLNYYLIEVVLYFTQDITNYYFWNGTDDVTADITNYFLTDGSFTDEDAHGNMQVTNIQPVSTADRRYITTGDEIRTAPGGAGLLVGTVTTDMIGNHLASFSAIKEAASRYQFITANFYADADSEAMYGVSGAARAFSYDGFYFTTIYAIEEDEKDKPRHITNHQFHLILGYPSGANLLSVAGNPLSFDGLLGATEIDTGDPIMGYVQMNGTTLGIFCQSSTQGLVGTSSDNFSLGILSPYEGSLEYALTNTGQPTYCSYRGVSIFSQTAAYGDYAGQRLSAPVSPWILPRLQGTISPLGDVSVGSGFLTTVPCRTKNQDRIYFKDGYCLIMTLVGADQTPQFTLRCDGLYELLEGNNVVFIGNFVPRAETSFVDSSGVERIIMSHYSDAYEPASGGYYAYEFERSWTDDGFGIPSYLVSNENFYGSMFDWEKFSKVRLHGLSLGYAPLYLNVDTNYKDNFVANQNTATVGPISLPRTPAAELSTEYVNTTNIVNMAKDGRSFNFRFMSHNLTNTPTTRRDPVYADVCPPFVLQGMLVQTKEGKGDI